MKRFARILVLAVCVTMLLSAGWCERYDRKNQRREGVRHYYDSVLREERLHKDSVWKANRKEWERQNNPEEYRQKEKE